MSYSAGSSGFSSGEKERFGYLDLSNYKLISGSYPVEIDYEGESIFCHCKLKAPRWSSWTSQNPGRRFYGCHRYPEFDCGFHTWHDPKFPDRARGLISELRRRERQLYENVKNLKNEVADLRENAVELVEAEVIKENFQLKTEVDALKVKLKELEENTGRNGTKHIWTSKSVIFLGLCVIFLVYFSTTSSHKAISHVQYALP